MKKHLLFLFAILISVGSAWAQTGTLVSMSSGELTVRLTARWSGDGKILANGIEIPNNVETDVPVSSRRVILTASESGNVALTGLTCFQTDLRQLDVTNCTELLVLNCNLNYYLESLDVSKCTKLRELHCYGNSISSLDVSRLTNLIQLNCAQNSISSLDVSRLTNLTILGCTQNNISVLDVSNLTKLTNLNCNRNNISTLDISNLINLEVLYCGDNNLTSLDVSKCTKLRVLEFVSSEITSINVSNCPRLSKLYCSNNLISSLDLSNCSELDDLTCSSNLLSHLDLSNLTKLTILYCENNKLSSLDLSNCPNVKDLGCSNNRLAYLNLGDTQLESMFAHGQNVTVSITDGRYRNPIRYIKAGVAEDIEIERVKYTHNSILPTQVAYFKFTTDKTEASGNYPFSGNLTLRNHVPTTQKPVESIRFSHESLKLQVGRTFRLGYIVLPEDATDKSVDWDVERNQAGQGQGQTPIISVSRVNNDDNNYNTAAFPGNAESMPVTSFSSAAGESIPWISNAPAVAYDGEFDITAIAPGTALLKITTAGGTITTLINIEITDGPELIEVSDVQLSASSIWLKIGESATLKHTVLPGDATEKSVYWTIDDKKIAKVSTSGEVTAIAPGVTEVIVTTDNGKYMAQCMVVVSKIVTGIDDVNNLTFQAYPNPTSGIITISGLTPGTQFNLYNTVGGLVGTYTAQAEQMTINLSGYAKGMYLIQYDGKAYKIIKK